MPALERPQPLTAHPGAPSLLPGGPEPSARRPQCQPGLGELRPRPRRIVFADELRPQASLHPEKPPGGRGPSPHPVPDYELKYPALSSQSARSCYAAVFHDQYGEFLELQRQLEGTQAKLQQLGALLTSLPAPRSQNEARVAARVWREFEKKRTDPGFLEKQARCRYLKGKLRHLKAQIRKFDDQRDSDSKGSVYF